jgi:SAM-dependent methyltransferase
MNVFGNYARYYDLLYQDKDYASEAQFIHQLIQSYAPATASILELGCGTGKHAILLSEKGYKLCGIDQSSEMLKQANQRLLQLPKSQAANLEFLPGDIRTVRVDRTFDAVISLFHVLSYQTTNQDLQAVFDTARTHLKPGGIFLFDCWYGPTVLSDRPAVRVKRLEDDAIAVTRLAEPTLDPNANLVQVDYEILIQDKGSGKTESLHETHKMRYLFRPEIDLLFAQNDFEPIAHGEWMTGNQPGWNTWGVYFIGKLRT